MKWFKHDTDANRDPKLEKVLMRYGAEGYALYWLCIELIAAPIDKHNLTFELEHDAEILAHRLKMDSAKVEEIMKYMVGLELFEIDATTQRVSCLKIANRIENSVVKNPNLREIQKRLAAGPGQSGKIPDDPGQSGTIPDNSGKVRLEVDTDTELEKRTTTAAKRPTEDPPEFVEFKSIYPKRSGTQRWDRAKKAINARLKKGATWEQILDGARRYAAFCEATGKVGTEYVMQAATFCGPERHFLEPWHPPPNKAEVRQGKNVAAGLEFLEKSDAE